MKNNPNLPKTLLLAILFQVCLTACELESHLIKSGLVDIQSIDTTFKVNIINATTNNMLIFNSYGCLTKCYLQKDAAIKLKKAQILLRQKYPKYSFQIMEGTRP